MGCFNSFNIAIINTLGRIFISGWRKNTTITVADRIVSSESDFFIGSTLTHTFMIFYSTLYDAEGDGDTLWEMYNSGMTGGC